MGRFIGEDLNDQEVAALQAVSNNAGGSQFGSVDKLIDTIRSHRDCRAIEEIEQEQLDVLLDKLEKECLIERKEIKGKQYVGLTDDGQRCNLINPY
jgi:hypothetical protein